MPGRDPPEAEDAGQRPPEAGEAGDNGRGVGIAGRPGTREEGSWGSGSGSQDLVEALAPLSLPLSSLLRRRLPSCPHARLPAPGASAYSCRAQGHQRLKS